jgi:hypothetical protein
MDRHAILDEYRRACLIVDKATASQSQSTHAALHRLQLPLTRRPVSTLSRLLERLLAILSNFWLLFLLRDSLHR